MGLVMAIPKAKVEERGEDLVLHTEAQCRWFGAQFWGLQAS